jgi:hypothetical protein
MYKKFYKENKFCLYSKNNPAEKPKPTTNCNVFFTIIQSTEKDPTLPKGNYVRIFPDNKPALENIGVPMPTILLNSSTNQKPLKPRFAAK